MTQMISAKDLARLHLDLEVPSLLSAILQKHEILSLPDEQIFRAQLMRMNSLETLISIACCFHVLSPFLHEDAGLLEPLLQHADYILDDYAPYLMKSNFPVSEEWGNFIHDDLETLGDLLCLLSDAGHNLHPALSEICDLLNEQTFLKSLNITMPEPSYSGNVIRFPVERRV